MHCDGVDVPGEITTMLGYNTGPVITWWSLKLEQ